jgi:integrase
MYKLIFSILYTLGLRVSEVTNLRRCDVDFDRRLLVIRETKFSKSRLVPFGPRLGARIREYMDSVQAADDFPLFWFDRRPYRAVNPCTISQTFHQLVSKLNLPLAPGQAHPRLHDLRHSFAVGTLLRWYREGKDPADRLLHLSTYLGHSDPASTAVYLTITVELLDEACKRFERFSASLVGGAE